MTFLRPAAAERKARQASGGPPFARGNGLAVAEERAAKREDLQALDMPEQLHKLELREEAEQMYEDTKR
jgi:hypothetical protein